MCNVEYSSRVKKEKSHEKDIDDAVGAGGDGAAIAGKVCAGCAGG